MIENRRGLTIFSHTLLIRASSSSCSHCTWPLSPPRWTQSGVRHANDADPGTHLFENMKTIWTQGVGANSAPFWLMMLNSFIMAFGITVGKITVSMLSAFAIVWFRFPLRNLFSG